MCTAYIDHTLRMCIRFRVQIIQCIMDRERELEIVLVLALYLRQRRRRKCSRSMWIRGIFTRRQKQGEYHQLLQKMRMADPESHFRYLRMSKERFDSFLAMVIPKQCCNNAQLNKQLCIGRTLSLTSLLHELAESCYHFCRKIGPYTKISSHKKFSGEVYNT